MDILLLGIGIAQIAILISLVLISRMIVNVSKQLLIVTRMIAHNTMPSGGDDPISRR